MIGLFLQAKQLLKNTVIDKLAKCMRVLMRVDWESVYLIQEDVMEVYLSLRR